MSPSVYKYLTVVAYFEIVAYIPHSHAAHLSKHFLLLIVLFTFYLQLSWYSSSSLLFISSSESSSTSNCYFTFIFNHSKFINSNE